MIAAPSPKTAAVPLNGRFSEHIPALDGLRGLAILAVFFLHYGAGGIDSSSSPIRWIARLCGIGWSGVDLFFVLSGFLITGILYDTQNDPSYYRTFYARRTLRIFPIYYLFAGLAFVIVPLAAWHKGNLFFLIYLGYPAALIWPTLVNVPIRITHLWSLSVEEQFYMLWPWMIRKLRAPRNILGLCVVIGLVALVGRIAFPAWAYASLPCRMDDLALGAALSIMFRSDLRRHCQQLALPVFAGCVAGMILICWLRHTTDHSDRVVQTLGFSMIALAYGALLVLSLGPLAGLFSTRILRMFGKYSYGMYLYHFSLIAVFEPAKPFLSRYPLGSLTYVASCLAANLAIAAMSFHLIEQPILRLKKRFKYAGQASERARVETRRITSFEPEVVGE